MPACPQVLLVAYWFPPSGGIAVQRALSLARYLPELGCHLHVLTPEDSPSPVIDRALLERIPQGVTIHRAWNPMPKAETRKRMWSLLARKRSQPSKGAQPGTGHSLASNLIRRVLSPDPEVAWVPFALRKARSIVERNGIDTVIVTAPPFSSFLVGNALKRDYPKLKLISDFRDEWLRFFLSTFEFQKSTHIFRHAQGIEKETVELSDAVVTVTPSLVEELRERYATHAPEKFFCIPNGYDPALFENFRARPHGTGKVVVTYAGTVYSTTSPDGYFAALNRLPAEVRSRIETRFVGRIADDQRQLVESQPGIRCIGYVPQTEALRHMEEADYLLVIMKDPTGVTGKIYEYLATGKPILALSPDGGEVAATLQETHAGWCIDPTDIDAIGERLESIATGMAPPIQPDLPAIRRYERPRLTAEFLEVIERGGVRQRTFAAGG